MIQLIPAIDLIDGKCVRLTQGDYNQQKTYNNNPLEVAKAFEGAGITRLHLVDLDGAKAKKIINHKVLESLATHTSLHIDFGGGLQSDQDLEIAFNSGARQITGGSIAVKNPELFSHWISQYGGEKIILGADSKDGKIAVSGWQEATDITTEALIERYFKLGIRYCICTDISKDGLLQGPSTELYRQLRDRFPELKLIASGGVASMQDIETLDEEKIYGVIFGKAYYEGRISLAQLSAYNS